MTKKPITTNQLALFKKVVLKYHRQLLKLNLNSVEMAELPWEVTPVQSADSLSKAHIHIMDGGKISLHCPYRPKFVKEFRETALMQWQFDERYYLADFGLPRLRKILDVVNKHYNDVVYCDETREILEEINKYRDVKYWHPTLVSRNDNLFIVAMNPMLDRALGDMKLVLDVDTLVTLTKYGVAIDDHIVNLLTSKFGEEQAKLITSFEFQWEQSNARVLVEMLESIGCDALYTAGGTNSKWNAILKREASNRKIPFIDASERKKFVTLAEIKSYKKPVLCKFASRGFNNVGSKFMTKVVQLVNSTPIEIK